MKKFRKKTIKTAKGQKLSIRYSGWFSPYIYRKNKKGGRGKRATLPFLTQSKCGVYIIRSKKTRKILYVGHSGHQLYKTLYRHFQSWKDRSQVRWTYANSQAYEVMVILTRSCLNAFMIEQYYHHKLNPRDGSRKLEVPQSEIKFSYMPKINTLKKMPWDVEVPF